MSSDQDKLQTLADYEGFTDVQEMFERTSLDSVMPGICTNDGCSYICDVEPDQEHGWCRDEGTQTVSSAIMLGGMI